MSVTHPFPEVASTSLSRSRQPLRVLAWPIDPRNPYTSSLYGQMDESVKVEKFAAAKLMRRYDVWHVHWPESLLNICNPTHAAVKTRAFLAMVDLIRLRGGKLVWTVHNLSAHDALHPALEAHFWRHFIPRLDGLIALSPTGLELARQRFPRLRELPSAIIPHGHYRDQYPLCGADARKMLGIPSDARVMLFFGAIRPYKNVEALVRVFRKVTEARAMLFIAGHPQSTELAEKIAREAALDGRVRLDFRFIESQHVTSYFAAADSVVLPYSQILNSGSALLALSFNRPVLVPDLGSMLDLKRDFGPDWVNTFGSDLDAATLDRAFQWAKQPRASICPFPQKYKWQSIRSETSRFYRKVSSGNCGDNDSPRAAEDS